MSRVSLALAGLASGLAAAVPAQATPAGLRGVVMRGPTTPVCEAGIPCESPAPGVTIAFVRDGASRRVQTDSVGRYRIALRPGRYAVRIVGAPFGWSPRAVTVPIGRVAVRNFRIDTGIR